MKAILFTFLIGLIAFTCVAQTTNCLPPPAGLVSWWPGEGNGNDIIGGNSSVVTGGLTFATGLVGQAFSFDGLHSDVTVPASASLDVGTGAGLTLEAWINPADTASRPIFDWSFNGGYGVLFWANHPSAGAIDANLVDTNGNYHIIQSPGGIVTLGNFQHVAVTYDKASGMAWLFLNGAVVAEETFGTFTPLTSTDLQIGYRLPGAPYGDLSFYGLIDEASLYDRALSPSEIQAIFAAGSAGKCRAPIISLQPIGQLAYWGGSVTFNVRATGSPPLDYLWYKDGAAIAWATNSSLLLTNLSLDEGGNYSVIVSNAYGSVTSSNALLIVNPAGVSLGMYPGLTIQGTAGKIFGIQYATNVGANSTWLTLTQFTLMQPLQLWIDSSNNSTDGSNPRRFYRVVPIP